MLKQTVSIYLLCLLTVFSFTFLTGDVAMFATMQCFPLSFQTQICGLIKNHIQEMRTVPMRAAHFVNKA